MITTTQRIPAHMTSSSYNELFDACYDRMLESLDTMTSLALEIEDMSEERDGEQHTDVALDIEKWDNCFVCKSGDMVFRQSKEEGLYVVCVLHSTVSNTNIGLATANQVFEMLVSQRRFEQQRYG